MKRLISILMLTMLVGCSTEPSTPTFGPVASTKGGPIVAEQTSASGSPSTTDRVNPTPENVTVSLVPYHSDLVGVSFSYPEDLYKPETTQTGIPTLKLDLGNGELVISSKEAQDDKSIAELVAENIEENAKASNGRIVSKDLGRQTLGGQEAWGVQRYFDSAAGRTDSVMYIVLMEGLEYRVSCGTKQGPPVAPWEAVAPVCERVLDTIEFNGKASDWDGTVTTGQDTGYLQVLVRSGTKGENPAIAHARITIDETDVEVTTDDMGRSPSIQLATPEVDPFIQSGRIGYYTITVTRAGFKEHVHCTFVHGGSSELDPTIVNVYLTPGAGEDVVADSPVGGRDAPQTPGK